MKQQTKSTIAESVILLSTGAVLGAMIVILAIPA